MKRPPVSESIPFGGPAQPGAIYKFLQNAIDEATLRAIAAADYGWHADEVYEQLVKLLANREFLHEDGNSFALQECLTLSAYECSDVTPLGKLLCLVALFDIGTKWELPPSEHSNSLARMTSLALGMSSEAVDATAHFVAWLYEQDRCECMYSLVVLSALLLSLAADPKSITAADLEFLERVFAIELRENVATVLGYENQVCGYEDACAMIAEGELDWLLCLDTSTRNHRPWKDLADAVLSGHAHRSELQDLRKKLCGKSVTDPNNV